MSECIEPTVVQDQFAEIATSERHFNTLESQYRLLASTWLLAAFAGMGYVVTAANLQAEIRGEITMLIAVASSLGIQLLWGIDLFVYHRLLDAYFVEGLRLESRNPAFPQARWTMINQLDKNADITKLVRLYYVGCSLIPLFVASFYVVSQPDRLSIPVRLLLAAGLPLLGMVILLSCKTRNQCLFRDVERLRETYQRAGAAAVGTAQ